MREALVLSSFPVTFVSVCIVLDAVATFLPVQAVLRHDLVREIWIGVVADLAYHIAWILGGLASSAMRVDIHFSSCAVVTSAIVTIVTSLRLGVEFGLPIGLATVPHAVVKWYGRRVPAKTVLKRPAAKVEVGEPEVPSAPATGAGRSDRYLEAVWGKVAQAGKKGAETVCTDFGCSDAWDLSACRSLLCTLASEDLRARLQNSPWMLHGGIAPDGINWLKEAATAFSIQLKKGKTRKPKSALVEEVMQAWAGASATASGTSAAQDASRRAARLDMIRTRTAVTHAYQHVPWATTLPEAGIEEARQLVLLYECPEQLRMGVASEFISAASRMPSPEAVCLTERTAARYVSSALERLHASTPSGLQLSQEQVASWQHVFETLPLEVVRPSWQEDSCFVAARLFFEQNGHFNVQKHDRRKRAQLSEEERQEDGLARSLEVVRRAKVQDVAERTQRRRKDRQQAEPVLLRRKLSNETVKKWEQAFGNAWQWLPCRSKETYVPGECVAGARHEWPREPYFCKAAPCYLCGADFDCKEQLLSHWRASHLKLCEHGGPDLSDYRVEEEMRKRIFHGEAFNGPYEVRGQEMRRIVGTHATHQAQSSPGSGCINHSRDQPSQQARSLGGCAVCARSFWVEDLYDLHLFTKPPTEERAAVEAAPSRVGGQCHAHGACTSGPAASGAFYVQPQCVEKVNQLLCIRRYHGRWPKIPKHELYAASVQHPHVPEWRWMLHTRRLPHLSVNADGYVPPVPACRGCAFSLSANTPQKVEMPRYALADDNWMGRMPFAFAPGGELLGDMTLKTLARGRMCVKKVIAEPERRAPPKTKQGGLRGNCIAFPQARLELMRSQELPAPPEEASRFMRESVIIALAGAEKEDLHRAKWAEIPRQDYINAARFCTAHSTAYDGMSVNEASAHSLFAEYGRTSDAVMQQAVPVLATEELRHRLEGPADTGSAGTVHEQVSAVDGAAVEECSDEECEGAASHAALPDEEFPENALPAMHFCADALTGGDMDETQAIRKVHAELAELQKALSEEVHDDAAGGRIARSRVRTLQHAVQGLLPDAFAEGIVQAGARAEAAEQGQPFAPPCEAYAVHTKQQPLSMYSGAQWSMCFPHSFPYGDGVFGLPRSQPLTFQQWAHMLILREELAYEVDPKDSDTAQAWFATAPGAGVGQDVAMMPPPVCTCLQCASSGEAWQPPRQPRWGRDRELVCCLYDSWRRMEQIRLARAHVRRSGYHAKLERICNATPEMVDAAMRHVGERGSVRDVLRSSSCDPLLKEALSELMVFTTEVVGSDGARARLRHEQNGFGLAFGPSSGFLTPNFTDVRSPLVVLLHGGGVQERYEVNLLDECPQMPCAREMLQLVAEDPVAQARYFILSMRLFCEHILGSGPFDELLRHNGWLEGPAFPDGFAASGLGGSFGMLAAFHGPIEEQARLSLHPHMPIWCISTTSEAWLRSVLRRDTVEAQALLRGWQERVLTAVQSMQLDSAAVLPLLLTSDPASEPEPQSTPFTEVQQRDCRLDGELEGDARDAGKRRPLVATCQAFVDHHEQAYLSNLPAGVEAKSGYNVSLTGAQQSRMPRYRQLASLIGCVPTTNEDRSHEAGLWKAAFSADYRECISVGQMHAHKETCFKYVVNKGVKKAKHCRFHFCHFVSLAVRQAVDGVSRIRDVIFARTGKDLVLPRSPGEPPLSPVQGDALGQTLPLKPTCTLGATVVTDDSRGLLGRVKPVRWNPLEGSSNGPAQVSVRGNTDFQSMLRTFPDGFRTDGTPDKMRQALPSEAELREEAKLDLARFEAELPSKVASMVEWRRARRMPPKSHEEVAQELREKRARNIAEASQGFRIGDRVMPQAARRFRRMAGQMVRESMASSIATMFYACDYATKPNMVCAPLLVALRDGLARLEAKLREESELERLEELGKGLGENAAKDATASQHMGGNVSDCAGTQGPSAVEQPLQATVGTCTSSNGGAQQSPKRRNMSKLEREACRRLLRQATAAQQAQVKGNCLMILQMLTRREVVRSHQPWQLMTKHAMWMAFEHRRQLEGLPSRPCEDPQAVTMLEATLQDAAESKDGGDEGAAPLDDGCSSDEACEGMGADGTVAADSAQGGNTVERTKAEVRIRRRNDTFYADYLHRACSEVGAEGQLMRTPLADMSLLDYGAFVRIVLGEPWDRKPHQYAFDEHHAKFHTHVQELRPAPAVPFIHGFTMPSVQKDTETNACFKQLLLRPHACRGAEHCTGCDFTSEFLTSLLKRQRVHDEFGVPEEDANAHPVLEMVRVYSYLPSWRLFDAGQHALAERADAKIDASQKCPVLPDCTCLRDFWLPGAVRTGVVQKRIVPLLGHMFPALREGVLWNILRLAGYVRDGEGAVGIAGTLPELARVQTVLGAKCRFTGPGCHEEQLTVQEFLAWRRVEYAARLDFMAEARGRPHPGREHPDAIPDDPDGLHGGADRDDNATFDEEGVLPGPEDGEPHDGPTKPQQVDPQLAYQPRHKLKEDEIFDSVHRLREAEAGRQNTRSQKRRLFEAFLHEHEHEYEEARRPRALQPEQGSAAADPAENGAALRVQSAFAEARGQEEMAASSEPPAPRGCKRHHGELDSTSAVAIGADKLPVSPKEVAAELIARSGVWRSKEQYLVTLFVLQPLQRLWEKALAEGHADNLKRQGCLLDLTRGMEVRRVFLHGPGGSGKTFCMTEVVVKVVRHFLGRRGVKAIAASNSAARLLLGKTMHQAGKMRRQQSMKAKNLKPDSKVRRALEKEWGDMFLLLGDELSLASPPLLAGISRRAFHGRSKLLGLRQEEILERTFGDVLTQVLMGDFFQLNPVKAHTLLEAFSESRVPGVPHKTADEDLDGYAIFKSMCSNVVLFSGTHRFLDADLPALLEIMRTPGGKMVPADLRARIAQRIQAGPKDPRIQSDFLCEDAPGFFCNGAYAAIQWEQVMRSTQLRVLRMAKQSQGPQALHNTTSGEPSNTLPAEARPQGQLVYYFQRADRFRHDFGRQYYERALRTVNLSKTAGLHGLLGIFVGMRVRLTKKVLAPELVQEASGEVVDIVFHPEECFGHPTSGNVRPAPTHPCWKDGYVLCDRLPLHVRVRFDACSDDYTGRDKPGVWHLEPKQDTWDLPVDAVTTIDHPGAFRPKRVKATAKTLATVEVTSCQIPLTHEDDMTYQNIQGKTVRGPEGQPKGLVLDLFRPGYMGPDEYFQHLYMGLGRARKLEWMLLRSFPLDGGGELDWSIFEKGPPEYLCEFMVALESRARKTRPKLLRAQRELGLPAFECLPQCLPDPAHAGRFLYNPLDWGFPDRRGDQTTLNESSVAASIGIPLRKRMRTKGPACLPVPAAKASASPARAVVIDARAPVPVASSALADGEVATSAPTGIHQQGPLANAAAGVGQRGAPSPGSVSGAMAIALAMPTGTPAARLRRRLALEAATKSCPGMR